MARLTAAELEARAARAELRRMRAAAKVAWRVALERLAKLRAVSSRERVRWGAIGRAIREHAAAERKRGPYRSVAALLTAELLVEQAEREVVEARSAFAAAHPELLRAKKRAGRRAQELRAEWFDRATYGLDDVDRALMRQLAQREKIRSGPGRGKTWLAGAKPDRARELFGEWLEENADAYREIRSRAGELERLDFIVAQEQSAREQAELDRLTEEEEAELRRWARRAPRRAKQATRRRTPVDLSEVPF